MLVSWWQLGIGPSLPKRQWRKEKKINMKKIMEYLSVILDYEMKKRNWHLYRWQTSAWIWTLILLNGLDYATMKGGFVLLQVPMVVTPCTSFSCHCCTSQLWRGLICLSWAEDFPVPVSLIRLLGGSDQQKVHLTHLLGLNILKWWWCDMKTYCMEVDNAIDVRWSYEWWCRCNEGD